jgi:hypothetical protein
MHVERMFHKGSFEKGPFPCAYGLVLYALCDYDEE